MPYLCVIQVGNIVYLCEFTPKVLRQECSFRPGRSRPFISRSRHSRPPRRHPNGTTSSDVELRQSQRGRILRRVGTKDIIHMYWKHSRRGIQKEINSGSQKEKIPRMTNEPMKYTRSTGTKENRKVKTWFNEKNDTLENFGKERLQRMEAGRPTKSQNSLLRAVPDQNPEEKKRS